MKKPIEDLKLRLAQLAGNSKENGNIQNKLKRQIRNLEKKK